MNTLETLCRIIRVRQGERLSQGQRPMKEMTIPREMWERAKADAMQSLIAIDGGGLQPNSVMGVHIKVIGE